MTSVLAISAAAQSQSPVAKVVGTVVDARGNPLPGVQVYVAGQNGMSFTGGRGQFELPALVPGAHRVIGRRTGYRPDTVGVVLEAGDTVSVWFTLEAFAVELEKVNVSAVREAERLSGFEDRRLHNIGGRYITSAEIDAQSPTETSDLLRRIPGLRLADSSHVLVPVSNRGFKIKQMEKLLVPVQCVMRIAMNGFLMESGFALNSISPREIHGIEIYNGPASIPAIYNGGSVDMYCGLIVIWTKSG